MIKTRFQLIMIAAIIAANIASTVTLAIICWEAMLNNQKVTLFFNNYNEGWIEFILISVVALTGFFVIGYLTNLYIRENR